MDPTAYIDFTYILHLTANDLTAYKVVQTLLSQTLRLLGHQSMRKGHAHLVLSDAVTVE